MLANHTPRYLQLMTVKDHVFEDWLVRVRDEVPYAAGMSSVALLDTLPAFYDFLVAVTCGETAEFDHSTIASEHGGQRARITRFDPGSVVHEFHLFRAALLRAWHEAGIVLDAGEAARLNGAIDDALRQSLSGFSLAEARNREQFFSALTHDLRSPLATATTALAMIGKSTDLAQVGRLAELAARQHARMESMIGDLLNMMVRKADNDSPLAFADTELFALVCDVVANVSFSSGRVIELSGGPVNGMWCAAALRRALENLLNNAVKYSSAGTPVVATIEIAGGHAVVSITNTGPPIPPEQTEAIFQLFRRAKRDEDCGITGWGIGLPYVRSVAEQHAGSVSVQSSGDRTTFLFDVPLDPRPLLAQARLTARPKRTPPPAPAP